MKNIRIIENCLIKGQHAEAGTVLRNVETALAVELVSAGRAVLHPTDEITTRDPVIETRDPKPRKKSSP